jgi:hypothetical protein
MAAAADRRGPGSALSLELIGHAYELNLYAAIIDLYLGRIDALPGTHASKHTVAIRYLRPVPGSDCVGR